MYLAATLYCSKQSKAASIRTKLPYCSNKLSRTRTERRPSCSEYTYALRYILYKPIYIHRRSDSDVLFLSAKFQRMLEGYGIQHQKALQLPNKAAPSESNISIAKRMTREYIELHGIRRLISHGLTEIRHKLNARRGLKRLMNGRLSPIEVPASSGPTPPPPLPNPTPRRGRGGRGEGWGKEGEGGGAASPYLCCHLRNFRSRSKNRIV